MNPKVDWIEDFSILITDKDDTHLFTTLRQLCAASPSPFLIHTLLQPG